MKQSLDALIAKGGVELGSDMDEHIQIQIVYS